MIFQRNLEAIQDSLHVTCTLGAHWSMAGQNWNFFKFLKFFLKLENLEIFEISLGLFGTLLDLLEFD